MQRRQFLTLPAALRARGWQQAAVAGSPPISEPHFPDRLHLFIWRNWELVNADRMAKVIGAPAQDVVNLGASMGLPRKPELTDDQLKRIYLTVIRQNWHVLPESQIIDLLGWTRKQFELHLETDDGLFHALGPKPECSPLTYLPPSPDAAKQAARIRDVVRAVLGPALDANGEVPTHFVAKLSDEGYSLLREPAARAARVEVDLTAGWDLVVADQEPLAGAARRFRRYMESAMGASLKPGARRQIRMEVQPSGSAPAGSFDIRVGDDEVRLAAPDVTGAMQGLYFLEKRMEQRGGPFLVKGAERRSAVADPRYFYPYFALYGDPLVETDLDPFPDGLLEKLAKNGMNGVWMQAVLHTLAPSKHFPEFGEGSGTRLANLNRLVERSRRFGIEVFLYVNEPRPMSFRFFEKHPEIKGARGIGVYQDFYAMCTSVPAVREWIGDSLTHIAREVPDLGGFFSITHNEGLAHCYALAGGWDQDLPSTVDCPRCAKRQSWDVIGELIQTFHSGIRRANAKAKFIVWDWGWGDRLAENVIPLLPADARLLSLSEWDVPIQRGGVSTRIHEYSISAVGPGPRATKNWDRARKRGLSVMAKVEWNNTWEIAAVPYIPVVPLIVQHCENLSRAGITGLMATWTQGGYPSSPNVEAAAYYYFEPRPAAERVLSDVAQRRYGQAAAAKVISAWRKFSEAFQEYPHRVAMYLIPAQHGPANLLRFRPSGYRASNILFPHDDLRRWTGVYPAEAAQTQFAKMARGWRDGLALFRAGLEQVPPLKKEVAALDLAVAESCHNHFQTVANQIEFYLLRERLGQANHADRQGVLARMRALAEEEIELARRQYSLARRHSEIAYAAAEHYFYRPLDLAEKILNCRYIIDREIPSYGG